jgi:hypothetical protein
VRLDPGCERCGRVESMEHLPCECEHYLELLWNRMAEMLTQLFNSRSVNLVPRAELVQINIIYDIPHPSILLCIPDKTTRNTLILLMYKK